MNKHLLQFAFIAGALVLGAPSVSFAQHVHFSFGGGHGHGHHHHHHHHRPSWGLDWCLDPYYYHRPYVERVYVVPPPVRERVVYVEPAKSTSVTPPLNSVPATSAAPAPAPTSLASSAADTRVMIRNSAGKRLPVVFLIDQQDVELRDGESRSFLGKTSRTVQFDRGGSYGTAQVELTAGTYEFVVTATGWDLVPENSPALGPMAIKRNELPTTR